MNYDVIIIGAGPGGIFAAYELMQRKPDLKIAVFEAGHALHKRHCPIDGDKVKTCIGCKTCSIMSGFGGAGAFSDGKYNITNDFGGTLYEYIGKKQALDLMRYVDEINLKYGGEGTKLYSTAGTSFKQECIKNDFEKSIFAAHPDLATIKESLIAAGAVYAAMSGSGSAIFGLFESEASAEAMRSTTPYIFKL